MTVDLVRLHQIAQQITQDPGSPLEDYELASGVLRLIKVAEAAEPVMRDRGAWHNGDVYDRLYSALSALGENTTDE